MIERIEQERGSIELADNHYDLVVIGAGINGAGIARDAALRGLSVLLLDKTDIGAGTTSWSSRLIHGGLRYLEHVEISLVRESLRERERLLRVAPHLVQPLPLTIPIYGWHRRGTWLIRAGMIAYDVLSFDKTLPRHHMMTTEQALQHEPGLSRLGLKGAARYYDAQVAFPERVAVENAIAAAAHDADIRTCAEVTTLLVEAGVVRGVSWRDTVTGEHHRATAAVTVNVAGPWVDRVLARMGLADMPRMIGGTKGSHIVVDPFPGAPSDALYIEAKQDGRPYFIIPWNGLYLIGTTDIRYESDLDCVVPSEEEIQYIIDETNTAIPSAGLTRASVNYAYAGLRPLPYQPDGKESAITRRHIVQDHAPRVEGLLSVIGGKLTTYRSLSEHTVDAVVQKLGRSVPASITANATFPGAIGNLKRVRQELTESGPAWLERRSAEYLLRVYGTRSERILASTVNGPDELKQVVDEETGLIGAAVDFAFKEEHARTLADVVMRRTMVGYARGAGIDAGDRIATLAEQLGYWSGSEAADQVTAFRSYMTRFLPRNLDNV